MHSVHAVPENGPDNPDRDRVSLLLVSRPALSEIPSPGLPSVESAGLYGHERTLQVALGDLDGDGDLDVFAPTYGQDGGPNVVWLNELR